MNAFDSGFTAADKRMTVASAQIERVRMAVQ